MISVPTITYASERKLDVERKKEEKNSHGSKHFGMSYLGNACDVRRIEEETSEVYILNSILWR